MSDSLPDTPNVARVYCPGCEPDADPDKEILDVFWCHRHQPMRGGEDDAAVTSTAYLSGTSEAGGEENRSFCDWLHRKKTLLRGTAVALIVLGASVAEARDPKQVRAFRATHACPTTGEYTGACPGWVVDHSYPLCAGGQDLPSNMAWQERRQSYIKDRIERELCAYKARPACGEGGGR